MITRLLIANRGEIACRIIKTARQMGIHTIAIYARTDAHALHVKLAHEAYHIDSIDDQQPYLNKTQIISIALHAKADAIHPGYGFLAENAEFARQCLAQGLIFIGPPAEVIALMGDKAKAKQYLMQQQIPVIPGYAGTDQTPDIFLAQAALIGFPILLKAAGGGGGKGMCLVHHPETLVAQLSQVQQEAWQYFGTRHVILEKYLPQARHIEVQIFSDRYNQHLHLFERDCSIQRRHQKILEESPAPGIDQTLRESLWATAIQIAEAIGYQGAGTIEFLVEHEQHYFMEMNTRLQVEHPVTELLTGIDLVAWQIKIAAGEPLPLLQSQIQHQGHALEARIYAEDPKNHFFPSVGILSQCQFPSKSYPLRIDTGVVPGDNIPAEYDPLLAKIITHAASRETAIQQLQEALQESYLIGVATNIEFLQQILQQPAFQEAKLRTDFLEAYPLLPLHEVIPEQLLAWAGFYLYLRQSAENFGYSWRLNHQENIEFPLTYGVETTLVQLQPQRESVIIRVNQHIFSYKGQWQDGHIILDDGCQIQSLRVDEADSITVWYRGRRYQLSKPSPEQPPEVIDQNTHQRIQAPMAGTITAIHVTTGEKVQQDQPLLTLEAMKMQHTLTAPYAGSIIDIFYTLGDFITANTELLTLA